MFDSLLDILIGATGSLFAVFVLSRFTWGGKLIARIWRVPYRLARILQEGGITRMTLSRRDYGSHREGTGFLRDYLATARYSIEMVSISMNVTQAEGSLISLFEERINQIAVFRVRITLLNPDSPVVELLAKSLDIRSEDLRNEIIDTLRQLHRCKIQLPLQKRPRLSVMVHDTLPIGSAILLDASPDGGKIQLETKLYRAPRIESFGFEITGPSEFYLRSLNSWQKVFDDSNEYDAALFSSSEYPLLDNVD